MSDEMEALERKINEKSAAIEAAGLCQWNYPKPDDLINCRHCGGQHLESMKCPFDPASQTDL